ncbi:MAG: ParB N-terminal domain-containing protein [Pseudomonadota bacterium]
MTDRQNRFGFASIDEIPVGKAPRRRTAGPMSAAVRETAENVAEAAEARVEQRTQNAQDARAWRAALDDGLVLAKVALDEIATDDLPRDRLDLEGVANADEMDELKASIRAYGQKEPIELYRDSAGQMQLKKGWRRLTALRALYAETGEAAFATAIARVDRAAPERLRHYVEMVEENILRQDLCFAEMAALAIEAAHDPAVDGQDAGALVLRLYGSLHKMKRSYIRAFVTLMDMLGEDLRWPKAVGRDLGVAAARALRAEPGQVGALRRRLAVCLDAAAQNAELRAVAGVAEAGSAEAAQEIGEETAEEADNRGGSRPITPAIPTHEVTGRLPGAALPSEWPSERQNERPITLTLDDLTATVLPGEVRLSRPDGFTGLPDGRLTEALAAFHAVLKR